MLDLVKGRTSPARPPAGPGPSRPRRRARSGRSWRTRRAGGFVGELWPNLVEAAMELFPAPAVRGKRQTYPAGRGAALRLDRDQRDRAGPRRLAHPGRTRARNAAGHRARRAGGRSCCCGADAENSLADALPGRARARAAGAARDGPRARRTRRSRAAVRVRGAAGRRRAARRAAATVGRAAAHGHARGRPQAEEGAHAAGVAVQLREVRLSPPGTRACCARRIGWA